LIGGEVQIEYWVAPVLQGNLKQLMRQFNGMAIVLENRYYGSSYPYNDSTTDHLVYHTTEQSLADTQNFARNVNLPGFKELNAPKAPWILYGGSLAGALVAFTIKTYPDTFYASIANSGVTQTVVGYSQWQVLELSDCCSNKLLQVQPSRIVGFPRLRSKYSRHRRKDGRLSQCKADVCIATAQRNLWTWSIDRHSRLCANHFLSHR
jgi:hypothetical protein